MPQTPPPTNRPHPIGRYAPSPTGRLHLGNLRTALLAHEDIRSRGGTFILRMEDTDLPRNVAGAETAIIDDLLWLGITFDEGPHRASPGPAAPYRQSDRTEIYATALRQLVRNGLIYPCTCSRKDLQSAASAPHGPDGPIYPGTCGKLPQTHNIDDLLTQAISNPGKPLSASLRFRASQLPPVTIDDEIHGPMTWDLARDIGDFVVLRRDGLWAYQFVCAVDDAQMGITRVVRGDDLLTSTPRQIAIIKALGLSEPTYRHVPLMTDSRGTRLSKRDAAASIDALRDSGTSPAQIRKMLLSS